MRGYAAGGQVQLPGMDRSAERARATKDAGFINYDNLSASQRERVDSRMQPAQQPDAQQLLALLGQQGQPGQPQAPVGPAQQATDWQPAGTSQGTDWQPGPSNVAVTPAIQAGQPSSPALPSSPSPIPSAGIDFGANPNWGTGASGIGGINLGSLGGGAGSGPMPQQEYATGGSVADYRPGGTVGGGPPGVDTVPANLNNGEYVLPPETSQAMGGKQALDQAVMSTTGVPPVGAGVEGLQASAPAAPQQPTRFETLVQAMTGKPPAGQAPEMPAAQGYAQGGMPLPDDPWRRRPPVDYARSTAPRPLTPAPAATVASVIDPPNPKTRLNKNPAKAASQARGQRIGREMSARSDALRQYHQAQAQAQALPEPKTAPKPAPKPAPKTGAGFWTKPRSSGGGKMLGGLARAGAPLAVVAGAGQAAVESATDRPAVDAFRESVGANQGNPWADAGADLLRTAGHIGNAATFGGAGALGEAIARYNNGEPFFGGDGENPETQPAARAKPPEKPGGKATKPPENPPNTEWEAIKDSVNAMDPADDTTPGLPNGYKRNNTVDQDGNVVGTRYRGPEGSMVYEGRGDQPAPGNNRIPLPPGAQEIARGGTGRSSLFDQETMDAANANMRAGGGGGSFSVVGGAPHGVSDEDYAKMSPGEQSAAKVAAMEKATQSIRDWRNAKRFAEGSKPVGGWDAYNAEQGQRAAQAQAETAQAQARQAFNQDLFKEAYGGKVDAAKGIAVDDAKARNQQPQLMNDALNQFIPPQVDAQGNKDATRQIAAKSLIDGLSREFGADPMALLPAVAQATSGIRSRAALLQDPTIANIQDPALQLQAIEKYEADDRSAADAYLRRLLAANQAGGPPAPPAR